MKLCKELEGVLNDSLTEGNGIACYEKDYSGFDKVVFMKNKLSKAVYTKYLHDQRVSFWLYKGSPHNPADHGFKSLKSKELIVFPGEFDDTAES